MKKYCYLVFFAFSLFTSVHAGKFYVAPNGNDDPASTGSHDQPWASLAYACTQATQPGDTIHIQPGEYTAVEQAKIKSGVTVLGSGTEGETMTKIIGTGFANSHLTARNGHIIKIANAENIMVAGIYFDGNDNESPGAITIDDSEHIQIKNVRIRFFNFCGIFVHHSSQVKIHDFYLEDAGFESTGYCGGNIWLEGVTDSEIHDFTIYAYGERGGYGIKATSGGEDGGLRNVKVFDGNIDLKASAMWNGGLAGNMAIEYWSGNVGNWGNNEIYNCTFNRQVSMDMRNAVSGEYSVHIYQNQFFLEKKTIPIELSSDKIFVSHNYLEWLDEGGNAAFGDYKNLNYSGTRIYNNVFNGLRNDFLAVESGLIDTKIYNNVMIYILTHNSNPTVFTLDKNDRAKEYKNMVFANNVIQGFKETSFIDSGLAIISDWSVSGNLIDKVIDIPGTNVEGIAELKASGEKPFPYFSPSGAESNMVDISGGMDMGGDYTGSGPDAGAFELDVPTSLKRSNASLSHGLGFFHWNQFDILGRDK